MNFVHIVVYECDSTRHSINTILDTIHDYGENVFGADEVYFTCPECGEVHSSVVLKEAYFEEEKYNDRI